MGWGAGCVVGHGVVGFLYWWVWRFLFFFPASLFETGGASWGGGGVDFGRCEIGGMGEVRYAAGLRCEWFSNFLIRIV